MKTLPIVLPGKFLYSTGYAHRTEAPYQLDTGIIPEKAVGNGYVSLSLTGTMSIAEGYAWNGASGPVIETKSTFIGSAFHDAGYQLIREGLLPLSYRPTFDDLLYRILVASGMHPYRAAIWHLAVSVFGEQHARPAPKEILSAP